MGVSRVRVLRPISAYDDAQETSTFFRLELTAVIRRSRCVYDRGLLKVAILVELKGVSLAVVLSAHFRMSIAKWHTADSTAGFSNLQRVPARW